MNRSRLQRHSSKESRRQAVLYFILSVGFVFFMIKYGLPMVVQFLGNIKGETGTESGFDIPLQAPTLDPLPEATFSSQIKVSGRVLGGLKVKLLVEGQEKDEVNSDADGVFEFNGVGLSEGENLIGVMAVDEKGKESQLVESKVVFDQKPAEITIESPANEAQFFGREQQVVAIVGKVDDEKAEVSINGNYVRVESEGKFNYKMRLNGGMNELVVTAIDSAGNRSEQLLRVNFSQ